MSARSRNGQLREVSGTRAIGSGKMARNPILDVPLNAVIRTDIALPLQHVLQLYTVGNFLSAWRNPKNHKSIEQVFDTPDQARHAVATCAAWLGVQTKATSTAPTEWWPSDRSNTLNA
jgi:hypothetical protein